MREGKRDGMKVVSGWRLDPWLDWWSRLEEVLLKSPPTMRGFGGLGGRLSQNCCEVVCPPEGAYMLRIYMVWLVWDLREMSMMRLSGDWKIWVEDRDGDTRMAIWLERWMSPCHMLFHVFRMWLRSRFVCALVKVSCKRMMSGRCWQSL